VGDSRSVWVTGEVLEVEIEQGIEGKKIRKRIERDKENRTST